MTTVRWNLFRLKKDYANLKKGTLLLHGFTTEDGIEYYDISTEMKTGHSYSYYNIPYKLLEYELDDATIKDVDKYFKNN